MRRSVCWASVSVQSVPSFLWGSGGSVCTVFTLLNWQLSEIIPRVWFSNPVAINIRSPRIFLQNHRCLRGWQFFILQLHINFFMFNFLFCCWGLGTKNTWSGLRMEMSAEILNKKKNAFYAANALKYLQLWLKLQLSLLASVLSTFWCESQLIKHIIWTWDTTFGANVDLGCICGLQKRYWSTRLHFCVKRV